jgi:hypothetical protein
VDLVDVVDLVDTVDVHEVHYDRHVHKALATITHRELLPSAEGRRCPKGG